jgi:hypothetical protein
VTGFSTLDYTALAFFFVAWLCYHVAVEATKAGGRSLNPPHEPVPRGRARRPRARRRIERRCGEAGRRKGRTTAGGELIHRGHHHECAPKVQLSSPARTVGRTGWPRS